jgi:hypothetical protein
MGLSSEDYARLLAPRTRLRHFRRWREQQAQVADLTPARHRLMLAVRALPRPGPVEWDQWPCRRPTPPGENHGMPPSTSCDPR